MVMFTKQTNIEFTLDRVRSVVEELQERAKIRIDKKDFYGAIDLLQIAANLEYAVDPKKQI
jgi:uncharacterized protein (DUF433 family)